MENKSFIRTINFGYVPVRSDKRYTDGQIVTTIDLADYGDNIEFASIRYDYRTNQPFAVLLDGDFKEIVK